MINVSIVLYHTPIATVRNVVNILKSSPLIGQIWLIDNSQIMTEAFMFMGVDYIFNNKNIGYGAGHNIAIRKSIEQGVEYHIVMNSDISFDPAVLQELLDYMEANKDVAVVMPRVNNPDGSNQYLAKLLPTPVDLFVRRFMPPSVAERFNKRYQMKALVDQNRELRVPYLSGCFMFFRVESLIKEGLFDERFFLYPEDIDITRRLWERWKTIYYPKVEIYHEHQRASYHNFKLTIVHIVNMCRYFNKWGWIFDSGRRQINREANEG